MHSFIHCALILLLTEIGYSQIWPFSRQENIEEYRQGPKKSWSKSQYNYYYNWRNELVKQQYNNNSDDQILRRQKAILNGNKITSEIWNYGSISSPGNRVSDIVWEGLGYGYEFGPFICAEIPLESRSHEDAYSKVDSNGDTTWYVRAISDGLVSLGGEVSPDGKEFWGWEPLAYNDQNVPYGDQNSDYIPTSNDIDRDGDGKPDSWAEGWYNENLKKYVWPGALRQGSSNADMESFFVVDDRQNKEFEYYPFSDDSSRKGLGIEIECRYYQWSNPLAEDIIFLIYRVTNVSTKNLNNVTFGMWGDPHVGGPSNWRDDLSFFDREINMVYCWDADGVSDVAGRPPGYFGYKFLESPGEPLDGLDNDEDGMVDESQTDGIDNDNDWDPEKHDVGVDGLPNTGDQGEGDGIPTAGDPFDIREPGEPNFEWTDLDESDMIGLTGFAAPQFGGNNSISNDHHVFQNFLTPGLFDSANSEVAGDYIFIYSSGPIELPAGASRRFSIALLVGQDYDDLTLNAVTSQSIYEKNYQFAKPPEKPTVTAVPGNEKVTLYWNDIAESSIDPISEKNDFEGYVIYRSIDPQFLDQQTITDAYGTKFLFEPLKTSNGASARFDLDNDYVGLSTIPYTGRGVYYYLGNNTGIQHAFVDSNNVINGQSYYYSVVSYDHGDVDLEIPPTECSKLITVNPENNEIFLDLNTVQVIPRAPAGGYQSGYIENQAIVHTAGIATGNLDIEIIDPMAMEDSDTFIISFDESPLRYSVEDLKVTQEVFIANIDKYISLGNSDINDSTFSLTSSAGNTIFQAGVDYILDSKFGRVQAVNGGGLTDGGSYLVQYTYFPIRDSELYNWEESNPVFDGMKLFVQGEDLELDIGKTGWNSNAQTNFTYQVGPYDGVAAKKYPADYEVHWSSSIVDTGDYAGIKANFKIYEVTNGMVPKEQRFAILDYVEPDGQWTPRERVILFLGETGTTTTWEFTLFEPQKGEEILPTDGDILSIVTKRPFTSTDAYTFVSRSSKIDKSLASGALDKISVVPNPYVVTNVLERLDLQNPRDRGPRRVYFNHLPAECTIRIYSMDGSLVNVLHHKSEIDDGKEFWDLTTMDNFPIAYGVYVFHVDAGDIGETIGRFAVIK